MTGRDRQTVADMAVEHCGSAEAVFAIARRNGIPADAEAAGMALADEAVADRRAAEYIRGGGFSPANACGSRPDVLTSDPASGSRPANVVTETGETIVQ